MKSKLLSILLVSSALLAAGQVSADPSTPAAAPATAITKPQSDFKSLREGQHVDFAASTPGTAGASPAAPAAADTGSPTKSKKKKKAAAPVVTKPGQ